MNYLNVLSNLQLAASRGHISFEKLEEDYVLGDALELKNLSDKLHSTIEKIKYSLNKTLSETYLKILNLAYQQPVSSPNFIINEFINNSIGSVLKEDTIKEIDSATADGEKVYGDIYFMPRSVLTNLIDWLNRLDIRFDAIFNFADINDLIQDLGYSSINDFENAFFRINTIINTGALNRFLSSRHFYDILDLERNKIINWLYINFFETHNITAFDFAFVILISFNKEASYDIVNISNAALSNFSGKEKTSEETLGRISLIYEFKNWIRDNVSTFYKEGIGKRVYDIISKLKEEALINQNTNLEKINKIYNLNLSSKDLYFESYSYYNYFLENYKRKVYEPYYMRGISSIAYILESFYNEQYDNPFDDNISNFDHFFKAFNIYLANFMSDEQIVYSFSSQSLDDIKEDLKKTFSNYASVKLSNILSEKVSKKLSNNEAFLNAYNSSNKSDLLDISKFVSSEEKRIILLGYKSKGAVYSFKESVEVIKNSIKDLKRRKQKIEKIVKKDILNQFFDKLEDILIRQLKQEDLFLQSKSNSSGMLDLIKSDNELSIHPPKIGLESIAFFKYISDDNFFETFKAFHDQFLTNFNMICRYFEFFKDEAIKFFSNNDINSIKSSILKLLNFLNSKTSSGEKTIDIVNNTYNSSTDTKIYLDKLGYVPIIDIVCDIYKDDKNTTKKEYLQRLQNPLKLLHNFSDKEICKEIIKSETFKKSHNINIFQLQNIAISFLNNDYYYKTFYNLLKINKIPSEYITDNMQKFFEAARSLTNAEQYDIAMGYLIGDGSSEAFRKAKFVLGYVQDFDNIGRWIESAKPKDSAIFAPNLETENFRFRVLKDFDPLHFSIGVETDCCQTIGGVGQSAAIDSFINPYAGVLLLESKKKNGWALAAQSYFHYAEIDNNEKAIILDNIEAGNFKKLHKEDFYKNAYATLGAYLKKSGFKIVGCGTEFTNVINFDDFELGSLDEDPRHFEIEDYDEDRYTDFDNKSFYDLTRPKFDFKQSENIIEFEGELSPISASILSIYIEKYGSNIAKKILKVSKLLATNGLKKEAIEIIGIAIIK